MADGSAAQPPETCRVAGHVMALFMLTVLFPVIHLRVDFSTWLLLESMSFHQGSFLSV